MLHHYANHHRICVDTYLQQWKDDDIKAEWYKFQRQPLSMQHLLTVGWQNYTIGNDKSKDLRSFDSNRTCRFEFDSKVTCRFENFESAAHAVCRHTTNYTHSLFNKNINLCAICSWDICLQLHLMCSCIAVARAHTQLPHDNQHWTCKRLPPYSVRDSIGIRIVAAYSIWDSIRMEISDSQVPRQKLATCNFMNELSKVVIKLYEPKGMQ